MHLEPHDRVPSTPPAWAAGPPENEVPVPVAAHAVLARTADLAVALVGGHVYSTGVELDLVVRRRRDDAAAPDLFSLVEGYGHRHGVNAAPDRLLLGVELADGSVATNAGPEPVHDDSPRLGDRGGHGGGRGVDKTLWLTPVPPDGDVVVVCACEALGIPETRAVIPAAALVGARDRVVTLWPVEPRAEAQEPARAPLRLPSGGWFERVLGPQERPGTPARPDVPD